MALSSVTEAESLLALILRPGSLDGLYQDIDALLAWEDEDDARDTDRHRGEEEA